MSDPKNLWQLPILKGVAGGAAFVIVALLLVTFVLPAWAVSFPIPGGYVVDLGELAPWIGILVTLVIWRDARQARQLAGKAVAKIEAAAVQIDGLLTERDRAKVIEGEAKGEKKGVEAAQQLAEGQRQGIEMERASVAAKAGGSVPSASGGPLPVEDDKVAEIGRRIAAATEKAADAQELIADKTEDKTKSPSK